MEWYWQEKTEELGGKPVSVSLCQLQIPLGSESGSNPGLFGEKSVTTLWFLALPEIEHNQTNVSTI
jgi:hypothetical protein